jgi:hypothetical protein
MDGVFEESGLAKVRPVKSKTGRYTSSGRYEKVGFLWDHYLTSLQRLIEVGNPIDLSFDALELLLDHLRRGSLDPPPKIIKNPVGP